MPGCVSEQDTLNFLRKEAGQLGLVPTQPLSQLGLFTFPVLLGLFFICKMGYNCVNNVILGLITYKETFLLYGVFKKIYLPEYACTGRGMVTKLSELTLIKSFQK